ncbi:MAG: sulfotransferase family protein [Janthinobacterium lividum]
MLSLLGCATPKNLMPGNYANPKGYFESLDLALLHDELLASIGSTWSDWRAVPPEWFVSVEAEIYRDRIATVFHRNYENSELCVLKDPRMCRLLPLWNGVFELIKREPLFCFIDRNPLEFAASLRTRDGSSFSQGLLYYVRNHLDAEYATRGQRRSFVSYGALLADWREVTAAIAAELGVRLQINSGAAEVDAFLETGLRHQYVNEIDPDASAASELALAVHSAFARLAAYPEDRAALDSLDQLRDNFNTR